MAYIRFVNSSNPGTPPAGRTYLYVDTADNHIKTIDENGVVIDLSETSAYDDSAVRILIQDNSDDIQTNSGLIQDNSDAIVRTLSIATITNAYTITATDNTVLCDTSLNDIAVYLPRATAASGMTFTIKKISNENIATIVCDSGETLDGESDITFTRAYTSIRVQSNGTNWFII